MTPGSRTVFIVSHTHWDREWYRTFHEFRVDLVGVVREVLDRLEHDDALPHFLLDGQAIILEDYLEIHPEDRERIAALVGKGALAVGPWYILPDEFLVSGEATVRNLIYGHRVGQTVGAVQRVGYMPDSFGHIAQLPQILRGAGIDSFVYTRGNGAEIDELGLEYRWQAPDGSDVLAINQFGGYCAGGELGHHESWHARTDRSVDLDRAVEQVRTVLADIAERSNGQVHLLSNGCDHLPPQRDLGRIVPALREAFPDTTFVQGSLAEFVEMVDGSGVATRTHAGELLGGRHQLILSGVWSARMYLKQRNELVQTFLASAVEPCMAYAHFMAGQEYPTGHLDYAWKLLMQNHPHDSICGCSVDAVHRDMLPRFDGVMQTGEQLLRTCLEHFVPPVARHDHDEPVVICVMNPLPEPRTEVVDRLVLDPPDLADAEVWELIGPGGHAVPFTVVDAKRMTHRWTIDYRAELSGDRGPAVLQATAEAFGEKPDEDAAAEDDRFVQIQFVAEDLPGLGHVNYVLRRVSREAEGGATFTRVVTVSGNTLENASCRVTLHGNGSFDVFDKASETLYEGLNRLRDTEDVGDEYDHAPCLHSSTVTSDHIEGSVRVAEDTGLRGVLQADFTLPLPASIEPSRTRRSASRVDCLARVRVGLRGESPVVDVEVRFENRAKDHRLRAEFPTPIDTSTIVSEGHFYVNRRPIDQPAGEDWVQPPTGTFPQQGYSLVQDGTRGLAVLNRGLPEVAPYRDETGGTGISLTLLRAVGWLSRDDFATRRHRNAGPMLATPEAQCLGWQHFRYAVLPFAGDDVAADVMGHSRAYRSPPLAIQGVEDQAIPGGGSFLKKATTRTCISAVKKHQTRDSLIVRLFNLTATPVGESLTLGRGVQGAWLVNLLEERLEQLPNEGRRVDVMVGPHAIVSVEIVL
ncbi:MAG: glycosyl hydrolase-related protein [Gemmatimonadetes bacterium]|nr:glycosyl hydrolase-related protein [Gemmatimonadota bacterium]